MEKIQGRVVEVSNAYEVRLDNKPDWLEAIGNAKNHIDKGLVNKEVDIALEQGKITFIKVLGGNKEEKKDNGDLIDIITKLNWNIGISAKLSKLSLLNELEVLKHQQGLTPIQQKLHSWLISDFEKDFKSIDNITKEQTC